jgi:hypothetical protein
LRQLEPGIFHMCVAFVQSHAGAGGDPHRLVEIAPRGVILLVIRSYAARASSPRGTSWIWPALRRPSTAWFRSSAAFPRSPLISAS